MSALGGFWNFDGRPAAGAACARILAAQSIYGPHGSAQWDGGNVAFGRCLFDVLPEDAYDAQPLIGGGGRYVLVADLRLDNRDDLTRNLQIPVEQSRRLADSAILLAAWERWQENCFDHLVGDYAFALWDALTRRLTLARDPFGARPLHYHRGSSFFAVASMPKGLHALPEIPRAPDEERTTEIFAMVPEYGSRSFFQGVERVELGQVVTVDVKGVTARKHWNPPRKRIRLSSDGEYAEALRAHLDEAVQARLRGSMGTVGAHLSGGLDSSAVAATAARLLAPRDGKVVAFTSVPRKNYDRPDVRGRFGDEGPLAAATAALYPNMEHVLIRTEGGTPLDNLDRNFFLFERPIVNICNQVWYDAMNASARARGITVMLGAPQANLTMSYDGMALLPQLIAQGRLLRWFGLSRSLVRNRYRGWPSVLATSFGPWMPAPLWVWLRRLIRGGNNDVAQYTVSNMQTFHERGLDRRASEQGMDLAVRPGKDALSLRLWAFQRSDLGNYYKGWLGGWGIDVRDPSADRRLVEFCLNIPLEQFLLGGVPRSLARRAFAGRLPESVLTERRRGLQAADWHEGMTAARERIREEIERLAQTGPATASLDIARMRQLVENWPDGNWEREEIYYSYRLALLRGISSGHFLRKASGGNA